MCIIFSHANKCCLFLRSYVKYAFAEWNSRLHHHYGCVVFLILQWDLVEQSQFYYYCNDVDCRPKQLHLTVQLKHSNTAMQNMNIFYIQSSIQVPYKWADIAQTTTFLTSSTWTTPPVNKWLHQNPTHLSVWRSSCRLTTNLWSWRRCWMVTVSTFQRQWCIRRVTGQLWFPVATICRSVKTFLELAPLTVIAAPRGSTCHTGLAQRRSKPRGLCELYVTPKRKLTHP